MSTLRTERTSVLAIESRQAVVSFEAKQNQQARPGG
jgi:hypothetical protein